MGALLLTGCGSGRDVAEPGPAEGVPTVTASSSPTGSYCAGTAPAPVRHASLLSLRPDGTVRTTVALPDVPNDAGEDQDTPVLRGDDAWLVAGGEVRRYDAATGEQRWGVPVTGPADGLWLDDGLLVALVDQVSPRAYLLGLDPESGEQRWRYDVPTQGAIGDPRLTGDHGLSWVHRESGAQVLDLATGRLRWSHAPADTLLLPLVGDGVVVVKDGTRLRAYDSATGAERWSTDVPGLGGALVAGDLVVANRAEGGGRVALRLEDGEVAWRDPTPGRLVAAGAAGILSQTSPERELRLVDPGGRERFEVRGQISEAVSPATFISDDDVVGLETPREDRLVSRDLEGTVRWSVDLDGYTQHLREVGSTIVVLVSGADVQQVRAYARDSGRLLWSVPLPHYGYRLAANADGVLVRSQDVALFCATAG